MLLLKLDNLAIKDDNKDGTINNGAFRSPVLDL